MPVGIGVAVAGVGAAAIGARATSKAASKAANAANDTAEANLQNAREYRDMMRSYVDPLTPYAYAGASALASRLGLNPRGATPANNNAPPASGMNLFAQYGGAGVPAAASPAIAAKAEPFGRREGVADLPSPDASRNVFQADPKSVFSPQAGGPTAAPAAQPGPDGAAYMAANPDVMAEFQRNMSSAKGREYLASIGADTPDKFGVWHIENFGRTEGRDIPMAQPAASGAAQPTAPADLGPAAAAPGGDQWGVSERFQRSPVFAERQEFTRPTPGAAPELSSFLSNFQEDPGYRFRLQEGADSVNAFSAARGKLRSGDAAKAIMARSSDLASQEYGNWFDRQLRAYAAAQDAYRFDTTRQDRNFDVDVSRYDARYDADRAFDRGAFESDRGFDTSRWDTQTQNLFALTGIGTGAINTLGGVSGNYLNAANAANTARGDATANAAIASGSSAANLFGQAAQGIGAAYGASGYTPNTSWLSRGGAPQSNLGSVNYGSSLSNPFSRSYSF